MAMNIKFDLVGNPEPPAIILANRNGNKLGQLNVNADSIEVSDKFNDASELSFTLNKYIDGELTPLWDKVVDFKLVYCKEWDEWFEIKVELDEATETVKTVFCTQLGQAELSQIMLYNIEINTDIDIERDDYKISILYDPDHPEESILSRILKDKAPHYSIAYVSPTIAKIQRSFSFDGTSIYDALQEIAEEIGCLFLFYASINKDGVLERKIAVHDLQQNCNNNECGYRGEFTDKCPKCGGIDITYGYGEDTLIFITSDELASEGIQLTTDTDAVKNCFKLEAGDDLMTATIRNCNPNGTDYIWYFSDNMKEDMSEELVEKIESYDEHYKKYYNEHSLKLDETLLTKYNDLVDDYSKYNKNLEKITSPIVGYPALMNAHYNTIDLALYLESGLMPNVEMSETNATKQLQLLTDYFDDPDNTVAVNVKDVANISKETANSAVLSMAKVIVKSTYKVEIKTSTLSANKVWSGKFIITNYSNEEDTATNIVDIDVTVSNDTEEFIKQKIEKALTKEDTEDLSISGLFDTKKYSYDEFCDELKRYALNPLKSFYDACEACRSILIDQGAGSESTDPDSLYQKLYVPYYNKSVAIANEIQTRENDIAIIKGVWNNVDEKNPVLITKGLQTNIEECRNAIQAKLNFETYLGKDLWLEFCAYRREDKYSNDNYISDGLNNAEVFKRALEFIDVAENEIYKSSELQHSISTTLNNLLAIPKFKPLVESFKTGNWIRIQVDDKVYKLRLLEYGINFGDFNNIPVEFSDVTKTKNGTTDVQDVFAQASSMATSYSSVQRQANQGDRAKTTLEEWISDGLNSANVQIQSNDSEDITLTKHGLLARSYDDVTETYSPEQLKITHNIMAYTNDDWRTVRQAIGKHRYRYYDKDKKDFVDEIGYGMSSDFVNAGIVSGSQMVGGDIYSENFIGGVDENGSIISSQGSYIDLNEGKFSLAGGRLKYDGTDLTIVGDIEVTNQGKIGCWNINEASIYSDDTTEITNKELESDKLLSYFDNAKRMYLGIQGLSLGNKFKVEPDGTATMTDAEITGTIHAEKGGTIASFNIDDKSIYNGTSSLTSTDSGVYLGIDGIRQYKSEEANVTISNGILNANGADITGKITATKGEFANGTFDNCTIKSNCKIDGEFLAAVGTFTGTITASDIVGKSTLSLGEYKDENDNTCYKTWISEDGVLNAQGVNITGEIHVTNGGTIGDFDVTDTKIKNGTLGDDASIFLSTSNMEGVGGFFEDNSIIQDDGTTVRAENKIDNWRMTVGSNFGVTSEGYLYANEGVFNGTVYATHGDIGGLKINNGIRGYVNQTESFVLNSEGLSIDNDSASIRVGNFETYHDITSGNTYWRTNGALYIQGVQDNQAITSIELMTDEYGDKPPIYANLAIEKVMANNVGSSEVNVDFRFVSDTQLYTAVTRTVYYQFGYRAVGTTRWRDTVQAKTFTILGGTSYGVIINLKPAQSWACNRIRFGYVSDLTYSTDHNLNDIISQPLYQVGQSPKKESIIIQGNLLPKISTPIEGGTGYSLGDGEHYWNTIYTRTSDIGSSDKNKKNTIQPLSNIHEQIFDSLKPVSYKFNVNNHNRTHTGLIAQDVKEAVKNAGLTTQDFAAYCEWENDDGSMGCGLRYSEFISMCIYEIQKLKKRVAELENNNEVEK